MIHSDFQNGINQSKYIQAGFDDMKNIDILTEVGTARCNFTLTKESGTTITSGVIGCLTKYANIFWFSVSSTSIWNRSSGGTYSTVTANTKGSGHYDAYWYDNWAYYFTASCIGRMRYDQSSRDDEHADFANSSSPYHPATALNGYMFVGDGADLCRVSGDGSVSTSVIALQAHMDISCIRPYAYDIAIFTFVDQVFLKAGCFRYDTASIAWSSEDYLEEGGINVAISSNTTDEIFVLAGQNGDIYQWNGVRFSWFARIKDISTVSVHNRLSAAVGRKSYFSTGKGIIYSISHPIAGGPAVLNKEFVVSAGETADVYSLQVIGNQLLVSWGLSGSYGIDKIDTTYATGQIDTPLEAVRARTIKVYYESLPDDCTIDIAFKNDNGSWVTKTMSAGDVIPNSKEKYVYLKVEPGNKRIIQARAILNPDNVNLSTPIIQGIEVVPY